MTESEVAAIIDEVDENKDGKLDYREVNIYTVESLFSAMLLTKYDFFFYKNVSFQNFH